MRRFFKNFVADEAGAVTVDWVVLAAVIIGLSLAVMASVSSGVESVSGELNDTMLEHDVTTSF